jgi:CRP/FNR family transcriptional regulator, anaerobic regulatory protein
MDSDRSRDPCASCDVRERSVCQAIPEADLARLAQVAMTREYEKGEILIEEGDPAKDFFNVTHGTVKLYKLLPDGRQQITGFASVGYFLGLAVTQNYAFSAQAVEPVRVCRFSRPRLRSLLDDFPQMEQRLLETACSELAAAQDQILMLGRKTAQERVASFLLSWSRAITPCGPTSRPVPLPMTRGEIADYLGLTIETVSRTFSRFRAGGYIKTPTNSEVTTLNFSWLENVAAGN